MRLRDPGFEIRDRDLKDGRDSETQNPPKTILRDQSQTLPRFRDWAKIFRHPRFSWNHSITLLLGSSRVLRTKKNFPIRQMSSANTVWLVSADLKRAGSAKTKRERAQKILRDVTKVDMIRTCSPATPVSSSVRTKVHLFQLIEALIIFRLSLMDVSN